MNTNVKHSCEKYRSQKIVRRINLAYRSGQSGYCYQMVFVHQQRVETDQAEQRRQGHNPTVAKVKMSELCKEVKRIFGKHVAMVTAIFITYVVLKIVATEVQISECRKQLQVFRPFKQKILRET